MEERGGGRERGEGEVDEVDDERKKKKKKNKMRNSPPPKSYRPVDRRGKVPQGAEHSWALERIGEQIVDPGAELFEGGEGLVH